MIDSQISSLDLDSGTPSASQAASRAAWEDPHLHVHVAKWRQALREEIEPLSLQLEKLSITIRGLQESYRTRTDPVQSLHLQPGRGSQTLESLGSPVHELVQSVRSGSTATESEVGSLTHDLLMPGEVSSEEQNMAADSSAALLETPRTNRMNQLLGIAVRESEEQRIYDTHSAPTIEVIGKKVRTSMEAILPDASNVEKSFGLMSSPKTYKARQSDNAFGMESKSSSVIFVTTIVQNSAFEYFTFFLIATNVIVVGLQIEYMARHSVETVPSAYWALDSVLCGLFALDISLRLVAYNRQFFCMSGWAWNVFDLMFCSLQIAEEAVRIALRSRASTDGDTQILLVVGVLRAVRVCRIFKITRYSKNLQVLLSCLIHSFGSFLWSVSLMLVIIYAWSIWLTYVTIAHEVHYGHSYSAEKTHNLKKVYGSVAGSVLYLFQSITGGVDWRDIVQPLFETDQYLAGIGTVLIIAFAIIALMNLITTTFVEKAIVQSHNIKQMYQMEHARKFFESLDLNENGQLSRPEILEHLRSRKVKDFFKSIDVDDTQADSLFDMLDADGTGKIGVWDFLEGCVHLQTPARLANVLLVGKEMRNAFGKQAEMVGLLDNRLREVCTLLASRL